MIDVNVDAVLAPLFQGDGMKSAGTTGAGEHRGGSRRGSRQASRRSRGPRRVSCPTKAIIHFIFLELVVVYKGMGPRIS